MFKVNNEDSFREPYSKPIQTYQTELFAKTVNSYKLLTIFAKNFILDVCLNSKCASLGVFK